jgi:hypothetical protein
MRDGVCKGLLLTIIYGLGPGWGGVAYTLQMDCKVLCTNQAAVMEAWLRPLSIFLRNSFGGPYIVWLICLQFKKVIAIVSDLNLGVAGAKV